MKQSTLIENILSKDNLNNAYLQVVRNKGAAGVDGMEYKALLSHLRKNGEQIKESIRNQTYKPMPVKRVEIPKEDGSKRKLGTMAMGEGGPELVKQLLCKTYDIKMPGVKKQGTP